MFILRQRSIVVVYFAIDDRPSNGWRGEVGEEKRFPGVNIGGEVRRVLVGMQQTLVFIFLEIVFCGTKCANRVHGGKTNKSGWRQRWRGEGKLWKIGSLSYVCVYDFEGYYLSGGRHFRLVRRRFCR